MKINSQNEKFKRFLLPFVLTYHLILNAQNVDSCITVNSIKFEIDTANNSSLFKEFKEKTFFFLGESHTMETNLLAFKNIFSSIDKFRQINIVALEDDCSWEDLYNAYVIDGDERCFNELSEWRSNSSLLVEDVERLKFIRKSNLEKTDKSKMTKIVCLDLPYTKHHSLIRLKEEVSRSKLNLSDPQNEFIYKLLMQSNQKSYSNKKVVKYSKLTLIKLETNQEYYKSELGEKFNLIKRIIFNLSCTHPKLLNNNHLNAREEILFNNFRVTVGQNKTVLAMMGKEHVIKKSKPKSSFVPLASRLNEVFPNKVMSILLLYSNFKSDIDSYLLSENSFNNIVKFKQHVINTRCFQNKDFTVLDYVDYFYVLE